MQEMVLAMAIHAGHVLGLDPYRFTVPHSLDRSRDSGIPERMTLPAGRVDAVPRVHDIGRRSVALIILMRYGRPVTVHTLNALPGMADRE